MDGSHAPPPYSPYQVHYVLAGYTRPGVTPNEQTPLQGMKSARSFLSSHKTIVSVSTILLIGYILLGYWYAQWHDEQGQRKELRRQWASEDKAREEDEKRRISAGLRWTEVVPIERCLRFGTREFTSQLLNLPDNLSDSDKVQWCYRTEVEIHGKVISSPSRCSLEDSNGQRNIYAHWTVSTGNPSCQTWWEYISDEGCVAQGSKKRRIRARLGNHLPPWDNWIEMCATTPLDMYGLHFDRPDSCNEWGRQGIIGFWSIHDESC